MIRKHHWRIAFALLASVGQVLNAKWGHFESAAIYFAAMVWLVFGESNGDSRT